MSVTTTSAPATASFGSVKSATEPPVCAARRIGIRHDVVGGAELLGRRDAHVHAGRRAGQQVALRHVARAVAEEGDA